MKRRNLIIVDDFLDNPDAVRAYALEQQFERIGGRNWPGRDSIDTHYKKFGLNFKLIDTAGIRKKSKINNNLEFYSVVRSIKAIESCDVCLLIMDATRSFDTQIKNIFYVSQLKSFSGFLKV